MIKSVFSATVSRYGKGGCHFTVITDLRCGLWLHCHFHWIKTVQNLLLSQVRHHSQARAEWVFATLTWWQRPAAAIKKGRESLLRGLLVALPNSCFILLQKNDLNLNNILCLLPRLHIKKQTIHQNRGRFLIVHKSSVREGGHRALLFSEQEQYIKQRREQTD